MFDFKGKHYIASFIDCQVKDLEVIKNGFQKAIEISGATILNKSEFVFENGGLTMVFLLSESHGSIHTYPEHNSLFIDFFTCGNKVNHELFHKTMFELFQPKKMKIQYINR